MKYYEMDRVVPRAKMQEGIDLCKTNVSDFLKDARIIMDENRLNHAYVSVHFAIEELGKLLLFKDALMKDTADPVTLEASRIFRGSKAHRNKENRAWEFLDPKYSVIFDEGMFVEGLFEKGMWVHQENTMAETETRLDWTFVDFYTQLWHLGRDIKRDLLTALVNHIAEKVSLI